MKTKMFTYTILSLLGILIFSIGGVFALAVGFRDLDWGFGWKLLSFVLGWVAVIIGQKMMATYTDKIQQLQLK